MLYTVGKQLSGMPKDFFQNIAPHMLVYHTLSRDSLRSHVASHNEESTNALSEQ